MGRDSDDPHAEGEVGKCGVAVDTLADMEDLYAGHRSGQDHDVDDDQQPGSGDLRHVRGHRREGGGGTGPTGWHPAERHPQGVPGPEGVRVPAAALDAAGARHHRVRRGRDAAVELDLHLGLPHPRGGVDRRPGAGIHPGQRFRLRRVGPAARPAGGRLRPPTQLLLQRPPRLLRGDRQVPRRPADLGPLDHGAVRRQEPQVDDHAVPHPNRRRVPQRPAARDQHRPHRHRSTGRRARRYPEPAHQLLRRGDGAPDREGGPHRLAHTAGDRVRDRGHQRRRPARRVLVRRGADRRDRAAGRGDLRPPRRPSAAAPCSKAHT